MCGDQGRVQAGLALVLPAMHRLWLMVLGMSYMAVAVSPRLNDALRHIYCVHWWLYAEQHPASHAALRAARHKAACLRLRWQRLG